MLSAIHHQRYQGQEYDGQQQMEAVPAVVVAVVAELNVGLELVSKLRSVLLHHRRRHRLLRKFSSPWQ